MKAVVTGVAGFIGSHLAERLLADGYDVYGVDKFLDNYPRHWKEENLSALAGRPRFYFVESDLARIDLPGLLDGASYVFHLAAQPGVRASWGKEFEHYTHNNLLATQRLLEACKGEKIRKFVFASSSSVYGDTTDLPMREDGATRPVSPYGMTKLACEHLCYVYWKAFDVPVVSLRYFTVYGPRQRPDMGFHIFMRALLRDEELPVYDDGEQTRDFTFYADIVQGTLAAAKYPNAGEIFNLGGGSRISLNGALEILEQVAQKKLRRKRLPRQAGDVRHTEADLTRARERLEFKPEVGLREGLKEQWEWLCSRAR
ncbi:MAG TPA: NAD-dependent epimerase/dehydratase family protein [Candidatus Acidoferrales bacterium]|nr:NAD-dependent epimerase/dehydratase family protein [Candidatus Acidoferrales bacterium]